MDTQNKEEIKNFGTDPENSSPAVSHPTSKPKIDWYQTESQVVIVILLKNVTRDDVHVNFTDRSVIFKATSQNQERYELALDLYHFIVPMQSTWKVLPSKVELKLKKAEGLKWPAVEKSATSIEKSKQPSASGLSDGKYPSSSQAHRDWDKMVVDIKKEEEEEKPEGDAALQQLFQKIYAEGSDEVRKAMNKSFLESGGTVLSTNWSDVGNKKIDVKPPDGMEWKNWQA